MWEVMENETRDNTGKTLQSQQDGVVLVRIFLMDK
jgi:hypothetical protein